MADGYARASGKPGICMAQVVGALNLAAGLRDAWLAHSPVIAMTGGREPKTKFRKVYQEVDDVPAFEPVTKFNATVDDVARFPDMVRQAFRTAVTGCPGPVHLQFRGNEGQIDAEEADMEPLCRAAICPRARRSVPSRTRRACARRSKSCKKLRVRSSSPAAACALPARRPNSSRSPRRCRFRSPPRSTARIRFPAIIRSRSAWSAAIRARARTGWSTQPTWSVSSAARPAA